MKTTSVLLKHFLCVTFGMAFAAQIGAQGPNPPPPGPPGGPPHGPPNGGPPTPPHAPGQNGSGPGAAGRPGGFRPMARPGQPQFQDQGQGQPGMRGPGPGPQPPSPSGGKIQRGQARGVDPLEGLSEEERQRVRSVMGRIWQREDVKAARDRVAEAGKQLRTAVREAALAEDSSLAPIIEKMRIPGLPDMLGASPEHGHQPPPQPSRPPAREGAAPAPAPEQGGGAGAGRRGEGNAAPGLLGALLPQLTQRLSPEDRDKLRRALESLRDKAEVKEALRGLQDASPEERRLKFRASLDTLRRVIRENHPDLAAKMDAIRTEGPEKRAEPGAEKPAQPEKSDPAVPTPTPDAPK